MTKIAWLVDTATGFTKEEIEKHPLFVVPMGVIINGRHYEDQVDLSTEEFYDLLSQYGEGAKTTQPNFQSMLDAYNKIKDEGYDAVIAVHPSSDLTGSYQNSVAASSEVDIRSAVIDSKTGSFPYKKMVEIGMKAAEEGKSFEEIVDLIKSLVDKAEFYLLPKSLQQMRKSGRVTASQSFMAGLFNIQIILQLTGGKVIPLEKIRTKKKVFARMMEIIREGINKHDLTEIAVLSSGDQAEAAKYTEAIKKEFPDVTLHEGMLVPVAGVHVGHGSVSFGWLDVKN